MMNRELIDKTYGLVLSGGGARGAYEMGVWKALKELGVKLSAVAGTSIGSINGALLAQGDYAAALDVWSEITPDAIFDDELSGLDRYRDIQKISDLLHRFIDEERVRQSDISYLLVTYNLTDFNDETLFIDDIPQGELIDYILASANHPVFKRKIIHKKTYIDGGVYNNLPAKPLAEKGYRNLLVVDIRDPLAMTFKKFNTKKHFIVYIKPTHEIKGVLDFSQDAVLHNLNCGYLDALKAFGKYCSSYYYLLDDDYAESFCITNDDITSLYQNPLIQKLFDHDEVMQDLLVFINEFRDSKETISVKSKEFFIACLEICADVLDIDPLKEYTVRELYDRLIGEFEEIMSMEKHFEESIRTHISDKIKQHELMLGREDRKLMLAFLLRSVDKIAQFYEIVIRMAPKISISYLAANLMLNRIGVTDQVETTKQTT